MVAAIFMGGDMGLPRFEPYVCVPGSALACVSLLTDLHVRRRGWAAVKMRNSGGQESDMARSRVHWTRQVGSVGVVRRCDVGAGQFKRGGSRR